MITIREGLVFLHTPNTSMVIDIRGRNAILAYYGPSLKEEKGEYFRRLKYDHEDWRQRSTEFLLSGSGRGEFKKGAVFLRNADDGFCCDFSIKEVHVCEAPAFENLPCAHSMDHTIKIIYRDEAGAEIHQFLSIADDCDVITSVLRIVNHSDKEIGIYRLASFQLDLYGRGYRVTNFAGQWASERHPRSVTLEAGIFVNESENGASSARCNPAISICSSDGNDWYGLNLLWSGNHKTSVECQENNTTRVLTGLNDTGFFLSVRPNEAFITPQACIVYGQKEEDLTRNMHNFVKKHIVRKEFANKAREILINSWESFYFDYDEDKLLLLADKAVELGMEMFVVDDGWFAGRENDKAGLGDWVCNQKRFPYGLRCFAQKVRERGLKFGIWIEPEMVNENSELFRTHPEWTMRIPNRTPVYMRNQLMLDLTKKEVVDDRIFALQKLFEECEPDYVKWDFNRFATDIPANHFQSAGEYDYKYQIGLYRLLAELEKIFPNILFESCASGGARFDLGMLCFSEQVWTSDNTDARDRLGIQAGTANFYPQSVMACHVSASPNHQTGNSTSLENRFNIACGGLLGYELDLLKLDENSCCVVREQIAFYKNYRDILQFGEYIHVDDPNSGIKGWIVLKADKSLAIAMFALTEKKSRFSAPYRISFRGLDEGAMYRVTQRTQRNTNAFQPFCASGALLNHAKLKLGDFYKETDRAENSNSIASRVFYWSVSTDSGYVKNRVDKIFSTRFFYSLTYKCN